ncbi:hypothetical protein D9615_006411 [Tricholomella constricta]|uniref:Uncharacterized protein n=1 Tax=Tricholomella constricta TaxID=117010 RepID=A0A8H5H5I5_9AGAR|nr:hypothetical protein D9615_006411 [Tricholomella constricta]
MSTIVEPHTQSPHSDSSSTCHEHLSSRTSSISSAHNSSHEPEAAEHHDAKQSPNHVHFRPRVRITSGISRHRHKSSPRIPDRSFVPFATPSSASSTSSSPSSSISAPLRSPADDETDKPGWGPLGRRVALLSRETHHQRERHRRKKRMRHDDDDHDRGPAPCERSPLLRPRVQSPITGPEGRRQDDVWDPELEEEEEEELEARISREIDEVFGTMPRRLLNLHVRVLAVLFLLSSKASSVVVVAA